MSATSRPRGYIADYRPQERTKVLLGDVMAVLEEYAKHLPLTSRQVYYRLGRFDDALKTLDNNAEVESERLKAGDWVFLAMIYQKRGDTAKAQEYYQKARRWREAPTHEPSAHARQRFDEWLAEAEIVLGAKKEK